MLIRSMDNRYFNLIFAITIALFITSLTYYLTALLYDLPHLIHSISAIIFLSFIFITLLSYKIMSFNYLKYKIDAINESGEGVIIVNKDGNVSFMNKIIKEMHKIERIENIRSLYPDIYNSLITTLDNGDKWSGETIIKLDNDIIPIEISAVRIKNDGFIMMIRNIEDKKNYEMEKEALQKQFFQSQKMEAIGRLAGGIAHDFNNILASILGYAEFLEEDLKNDKKSQDFAKRIILGADQAKKLIEQILAFSRRSETDKRSVDLSDIVKEAISMIRATLPQTIEMKYDVGYRNSLIFANENQIMQAIMNICVNAKDAMQDNKGQLNIKLGYCDKDYLKNYQFPFVEDLPDDEKNPITKIVDIKDKHNTIITGCISKKHEYISLSISDTGTGISKKVMEHLFEPFYTTKTGNKGTGLGLSTTHGVISLNKGAMIIDSVEGKGSKFELLFPLSSQAEYIGEDSSKEQQISYDYEIISNSKILIVDDQEEVRTTVEKMIMRTGYKTSSSSSPLEALDLIRENPDDFDLIVSDYTMPDMTGLDFAEEIHNDLPSIPIIILTGYKKSKLEEIIANYPSVKIILDKPIDSRSLNSAVYKILSEQVKNKENIVDFPLIKENY